MQVIIPSDFFLLVIRFFWEILDPVPKSKGSKRGAWHF
jgi:hypothetical protein